MVGLAFGVFVLVVCLHWLFARQKGAMDGRSSSVLKILLFFLQSAVTLTGSHSFLQFFNFDVFSGSECLSPRSAVEKLLLPYAGPALCMLSLVLVLAIHKGVGRLPVFGVYSWRDYARSSIGLLILNYNVVTGTSLRYLRYETYPLNGVEVRRLAASAAVDCDSAEYGQYLPVVGLMIGLYVVMFPLTLLALLVYSRPFESERPGVIINFLKLPYKARFYWWEVFSILRRAILVTLVVQGRGDTETASLTLACLIFLSLNQAVMPFLEPGRDVVSSTSSFWSWARNASPNQLENLCLALLSCLPSLLSCTAGSAFAEVFAVLLLIAPMTMLLLFNFFCVMIDKT